MMRMMVLAGLMVLAAGCSEPTGPTRLTTDPLVGTWLPDDLYSGQTDNPTMAMIIYADGGMAGGWSRGRWHYIDAQTLQVHDSHVSKPCRFSMRTKNQLTIWFDDKDPTSFHRLID